MVNNIFNFKYFFLPLLYILIGIITYLVIKSIILKSGSKLEHIGKNHISTHQTKRIQTVKAVLLNIIKIIIIIIVITATLTVFGIDVKSILTGLGLTAAILGLALQDLLKDIIGGMSIIFEDQFEVGDTIKIGDFKGEVISIGLKSTKIASSNDNSIKIIANRNISDIINYDKEVSQVFVDIPVAYEEDTRRVTEVITSECNDLTNTLEHLRGKVCLLGITDLGNSAVCYKISIDSYGKYQLLLARKVREAIKQRLDKEKIKIPYQQIEVHNNGK